MKIQKVIQKQILKLTRRVILRQIHSDLMMVTPKVTPKDFHSLIHLGFRMLTDSSLEILKVTPKLKVISLEILMDSLKGILM